MSHDLPASSRCRVATKPSPPHARSHPLSTQVQRRKPGPTRKKTETHNKAEAGKKCMSGRRVEERVKSKEATKGTRGSQRPSKGRAQGGGHGRHTASTTPHRDTGEGSTRGTREERHRAPRHTRHRHHTHRTHPTSPGNPPSSGRAVGRGTAPDLRRPSQWWKAPPPGTPFRHPHSEQRRPARAHAVGPVLGPHARIDRTRDTRVAEPWLPAPEDGRPGEGQRLTPGAPQNSGKHPPPATPFRHPHSERRRPARAHAVGLVLGPHARTDRTRDTRDAELWLPALEDGRPGKGQRPAPGAPHNGGKHPPPGTPFRHPHSEQRQPARAHAVGPVLGPHARTDRTRDTRDAEPWLPAPEDRRPGEGGRLTPGAPHNGGGHPPPGTPLRHPHSEQRRRARAHAVGPVLGPHARTDCTRDTRDAEPWLPAPEDGRPVKGQRLTPGAPHNGGKHPPRGRPSATPTASNAGPQGRTLWGRCWVPTPAPTAPGTQGTRNPGCPLQRTGGRGRDSA